MSQVGSMLLYLTVIISVLLLSIVMIGQINIKLR